MFFARILKEHTLFLLAGFPVSEEGFRKKADWFREQFEDLLRTTVAISDGMVRERVLESGEIVTEFTEVTEEQTRRLAGVSIDSEITQAEKRLRPVNCEGQGNQRTMSRGMVQQVHRLNQSVLWLLNEFIAFKEWILQEMLSCKLYNANYPFHYSAASGRSCFAGSQSFPENFERVDVKIQE